MTLGISSIEVVALSLALIFKPATLMKPLLYTFFLALGSHFTLAQSYDPFPTNNAVWDVVFHDVSFEYGDSLLNNFLMKYELEGDTLLNGEVYSKMYFRKTYEVIINQFTDVVDSIFLNESASIDRVYKRRPALQKGLF